MSSFFSPPPGPSTGKVTTATESMYSSNSNNNNITSIDSQNRVTTHAFLSPLNHADTPDGLSHLSKNRLSFGSVLPSPTASTVATATAPLTYTASPFKTSFPNSMRSNSVGRRATSVSFANGAFGMTTTHARSSTQEIPKSSMFTNTSRDPSYFTASATAAATNAGDVDVAGIGLRQRKGSSSTNTIDSIRNTQTNQGKSSSSILPLPPKMSMLDFSVSSKPTSVLLSPPPNKTITTTTSMTASTSYTTDTRKEKYSSSPFKIQTSTFSSSSVDYSTWVLVYGIPIQNPIYYQALLVRFASYGTIQHRFPTSYDDSDDSSSKTTSTQLSSSTRNTHTTTNTTIQPTLSSTTHFSSMAINWICIRYDTVLEAEKAMCQNGTIFTLSSSSYGPNPKMIVGVLRLDISLANELGLDIKAIQSSHTTTTSSSAIPWNNGINKSQNIDSSNTLCKEEDILLMDRPSLDTSSIHPNDRRRTNICQKIMSWFYTGMVLKNDNLGGKAQ